MLPNRLAFAALAVACIGAAAGGGYFASRQRAAAAARRGLVAQPGRDARSRDRSRRSMRRQRGRQPRVRPPVSPADSATKALSSTSRNASARTIGPLPNPGAAVESPGRRRPALKPPSPCPRSITPGRAASQTRHPRFRLSGAALPTPPLPVDTPPPAPKPEERAAQETPRVPEPPQKTVRRACRPGRFGDRTAGRNVDHE